MRGGVIFHADITLPGSLTGTFEFNGQNRPLKPGRNLIEIPTK
jgi:hypothetical protein